MITLITVILVVILVEILVVVLFVNSEANIILLVDSTNRKTTT